MPVNRYPLFFGLAAGGCLVDLVTKGLVFSRLGMPPSPTIWIVENILGLRTSLNEGALFGFGQGFSAVFAVVSVVAAVFVLYWLFGMGEARDLILCTALGCVMAGILGNLYDRIGWHGLVWPFGPRAGERVYAVRDFIHFGVGRFEWPTFNVADSLLVCGAGMLIWHALRSGQPHRNSATEPAA